MKNSEETAISIPEHIKALMLGGWTEYRSLSEEDQKVFDKALNGLVGVQYTPIAVATQVVNGVNYSFFCNAQIVIPNSPNQAAMISVHLSTKGDADISNITMPLPR